MMSYYQRGDSHLIRLISPTHKPYPVDEAVSWNAYDTSYSLYDSNDRPYHSNAVVLHVSMCCERCVQKVRKSLKNLDDVESVDIDIPRQRVIVRGYGNPHTVLRKVQKQNETATFWDSSDDYENYSSEAYDYYRPTTSSYHYKNYGRSPTDDYAIYTSGTYDYSSPASRMDNYDCYDLSPTYVYSDGYSSSPDYSWRQNYDEDRYSSPSEYRRHRDYPTYCKSYNAYRYR